MGFAAGRVFPADSGSEQQIELRENAIAMRHVRESRGIRAAGRELHWAVSRQIRNLHLLASLNLLDKRIDETGVKAVGGVC